MGNKNALVESKYDKVFYYIVIVMLLFIIGVLLYKDYMKNNNNEIQSNTQNTTTAPLNNVIIPEELKNADILEFKDISTNNTYYLVTISFDSGGDIYLATKHEIYDPKYNKIGTIPELTNSHIWNSDGSSLLSGEVSVTAELFNNKIYSLAGNVCGDLYKYESYIENGKLVSNAIETYNESELQISGEKC